ncbi:hypothetical protein [Moorena producens]|nr:hypothetical protein [Moorena producens]
MIQAAKAVLVNFCRLDAVAHGGNHGSRSWLEVTVRQARLVLMQ